MNLSDLDKDRRIADLEQELIRQRIYNDVHIKNYDLVENIICNATSSISKNFGQNLAILKTVCNKIEKIDRDGLVSDELISATNSMHEYISILQCEDRLFQIINGISSITDKSIQHIDSLDLSITLTDINKYQREMVSHYTIQEQRDIANNKNINQIEQHQAGTLELF